MTDKKNVEEATEKVTPQDFLKELREFAITVGEDCPEGHRREPGSGRCLPIGSTDHTAFTRSLNDDQGDEWRGLVDKTNETFDNEENIADRASASEKEVAIDADEMDEPVSCAQGTTFSFVQRKCVSLEEAERENSGEYAFIEEEEADHQDVVSKDPSGRRDPVGFQCPPNQFFDFKRRECIPLNKDTVMASECFSDEFKQEVATYARLALTSPDPTDGHRHVATLDEEGNGVTSMSGYMHSHSHEVSEFNVEPRTVDKNGEEYTSRHPGVAIPVEMHLEKMEDFAGESGEDKEEGKELTYKKRKRLPDSSFGVPGKRKFPLHDCSHVRNAMARFNQAKGLTSGEKATLRRKILARAKQCDIDVKNFGKANTEAEFSAVFEELLAPFRKAQEDRRENYRAESENMKKGPCPPGMEWDPKTKRCTKVKGFFEAVKDQANHSEIISKDPAGRKDTVNFQCPPNHLFDFKNRKCIPMDTRMSPGQPGDTTKASDEDGAQRDLSPSPKGKPARLPQDCPKGTIWDADLRKCKPLDSRKKTKSSDEDAAFPDFIKKMMDKKKKGKDGKKKKDEKSANEESQAPASGPGKEKDDHGCAPFQVWNPKTKKCESRKGQYKGKSEEEKAVNAKPANREGLVGAPDGKVKHPTDCPPGTLWDGKNKICRPLDSMDKSRPDGSSPQNPADTASVEDVVERMSLAKIIAHLDEIIRDEIEEGRKEKAKVAAKDLPNEAFPPSLVGSTRRSLMHHTPDVNDPYDTDTVDVARLRNALARVNKVSGYADKAIEDARDHLLFHAREIVVGRLSKKE